MNRLLLTLALTLLALCGHAQERTTLSATLYKEFRPSLITLTDGRQLRQPLTNVFLKNASLLYLRGDYPMEANMDNVARVDFDGGRSFVVVDRQLAFVVDSMGSSALLCVELFDQDTYERNLRNNINISNLDLGDQISTTTIDLNSEDDYRLPVFRHYYYRLGQDYVKVHERELGRRLSKEQRTMMKRIVATPTFSWQNPQSLLTLLRAITND